MIRRMKQTRRFRRTFLKQWREYRQLTQEQAAERIGMDRSNLSRLERGDIPYSQGVLEAAADAYSCEPWDLLNYDPFKAGEVVDIVKLIDEKNRATAIRLLRALTGTEN
jgi:transcriptional regulator with XRE-family HTH domain